MSTRNVTALKETLHNKSLTMEKVEMRSVIKYLYLKGKSPSDIHQEMKLTYKDESPSYFVVKFWVRRFKCGDLSVTDDIRKGRDTSVITERNVARVKELVLSDRRITIRHIAKETSLSLGSVWTVLHEHLNLSKVSARWVPRLLTAEMKAERARCCKLLLDLERKNDNFFDRLVTVDETWLYQYDPESKSQSFQWKSPSEPTPKKAKMSRSAVKVMLTVFWDNSGIILYDYLQKGQTMNGEYYAELLKMLKREIAAKRRGKLRKGVLLLQDNAPSHRSVVATTAATKCGFEILPHPAYSPDLAPSDFFLFPNLKNELKGKRFDDENDVKQAAETFLNAQQQSFYSEGLFKVKARWQKCITLAGDYVEK